MNKIIYQFIFFKKKIIKQKRYLTFKNDGTEEKPVKAVQEETEEKPAETEEKATNTEEVTEENQKTEIAEQETNTEGAPPAENAEATTAPPEQEQAQNQTQTQDDNAANNSKNPFNFSERALQTFNNLSRVRTIVLNFINQQNFYDVHYFKPINIYL